MPLLLTNVRIQKKNALREWARDDKLNFDMRLSRKERKAVEEKTSVFKYGRYKKSHVKRAKKRFRKIGENFMEATRRELDNTPLACLDKALLWGPNGKIDVKTFLNY